MHFSDLLHALAPCCSHPGELCSPGVPRVATASSQAVSGYTNSENASARLITAVAPLLPHMTLRRRAAARICADLTESAFDYTLRTLRGGQDETSPRHGKNLQAEREFCEVDQVLSEGSTPSRIDWNRRQAQGDACAEPATGRSGHGKIPGPPHRADRSKGTCGGLSPRLSHQRKVIVGRRRSTLAASSSTVLWLPSRITNNEQSSLRVCS
jgi:hypothetical protein